MTDTIQFGGSRHTLEPGRGHWARAARLWPGASSGELRALAVVLLGWDHGKLPLSDMSYLDRLLGRGDGDDLGGWRPRRPRPRLPAPAGRTLETL